MGQSLLRRRYTAPRPSSAVPSSTRVDGSGTAVGYTAILYESPKVVPPTPFPARMFASPVAGSMA